MKQKILFLLTCFLPCVVVAQQLGTIKGTVVGSVSSEAIPGVIVTLVDHNRQATTDADGRFILKNVQPGKHVIRLNSILITPKDLPVTVTANTETQMGLIKVVELNATDDVSMIGVIDADMVDDDSETATQDVNSTVILSNDVFLNRAAYQLSNARFSPRGYDNTKELKYINGVAFNDQNRGVFNYASIGALNDMTRNGDAANFTGNSTFSFGALGGAENIDMRAGSYAAGSKAGITYTNRNYYLRAMFTHATGLNSKGWAFATSIGGRYAHEGNVEGTFYHNFSFAFAAEKQWKGGQHSLSLTTFISPVQRGSNGNSYRSAYELTNNYQYNPNWGYQNGKKRSAKVVTAFDPTAILSHVWKINENTTLITGLGAHYGRYGNTALNWYSAPDPRPDYYRYLPEYFTTEEGKDACADMWRSNDTRHTQIDWDGLYTANRNSIINGNGGAAVYMVEERRSDLFETSFNSTLNSRLSRHLNITAGIGARYTQSRQFKTVNDLLGAEYVLDIDKFAEQDFPGEHDVLQNDLNRPDRKVYKGGIFGYNYNMNIYSANAWIVNQYTSRHWEYYYGTKLTYTNFYRDGKMKNGRYPDSSLGKGANHQFTDIMLKGGLTYKFNGRHMLTANLSYGTEAPLPNDAYISPRISDNTIDELKSGRVFAADINYVFSLPNLTGRIGVFQTNFYDQMKRYSYFDGVANTFINHVLYGMNRIHRGFELGSTWKIDDHWSLDLAGTISEYYYSNNPTGVVKVENGKSISELMPGRNEEETVYMRNVYVGGMPQMAGTIGLRYFINYWFLGANLNGFGRNYVEASALRRTASQYEDVKPYDENYDAYKKLTTQERFGTACTVDLSVGKVFYLKNKNSINFNLTVNNLLNRKHICIGGYEQGRSSLTYPDRFNSKYYYMQGINCFVNASYRF